MDFVMYKERGKNGLIEDSFQCGLFGGRKCSSHNFSTLSQVHLLNFTAFLLSLTYTSPILSIPTSKTSSGKIERIFYFPKRVFPFVCFFPFNKLGYDLKKMEIFEVRGNWITKGCSQIYYKKYRKQTLSSLVSKISTVFSFYLHVCGGKLARYNKFGKMGVSKFVTEVR